jgi:hypothetical protein
MFSYTDITDTKVDIDLSGSTTSNNKSAVFEYGRNLKIIRKVIVNELISYGGWFVGCTALEEIRFDGTIAANISFADCPNLTASSVQSIVSHLKNLVSSDEVGRYTIIFNHTAWDRAMAEDGYLYDAVCSSRGWGLEVL